MAQRSAAAFPKETASDGTFVRQESVFREWVEVHEGARFPAESGRYHLYVSFACPWAHRTIIVRKLKRLEDVISLTVVDPVRDHRGWAFTDASGADPVNGFRFLSEAYHATDPAFDGRVTVPVLWDRRESIIVNNESSEIVRMLNATFDAWGDASLDLYPQELRPEIDAVNELVYEKVNNGVYRSGFATTQQAYERAFDALFASLDELEQRLDRQRFLVGDRLTEADVRLFTTLVRFDPVYHGHFKCNLRRLVDYPNLWAYTRDIYQHDGIAETVDMDHIKRHYYCTHRTINPTGIVPKGPAIDFSLPHDRTEPGN
jgi:putative glutathione S-transferase